MRLIFKNEHEARVYVRNLRIFYQELRVAVLVSAFFAFVWLCSGGGYFWPLWFAIGWGASLVFRGLRLGILDAVWVEKVFGLRMRHLTDQWEDQKVKDLLSTAASDAVSKENPSGKEVVAQAKRKAPSKKRPPNKSD